MQDVSWAPAEGVATLSLAVQPLSPGDELHSLWSLDEDGCWDDVPDAEDPDIRTEHWLWTEKGHGPPQDMMDDPAKRLLLLDDGDSHVYIGTDGDTILPPNYADQFRSETGAVISVLEFDLTQLDPEQIRRQSDAFVFDPEWGINENEWQENQVAQLQAALQYAEAANAAIAANTDAAGLLTLRYEYRVIPFAGNELQTAQAETGSVVFQIKIQ